VNVFTVGNCYNRAMFIKTIGRVLIVATFSFTAFGAAAAPCDRACLKMTLNQYLTAMLAHKPSSAPPDQEAMLPNWPPFDGNWPIQPPAK
jgi:hypothetical protein